MAKAKFEPGDFVQLKSGGPKMVVEQHNNYNDSYLCTWFSGAKHNTHNFQAAALRIYEDDDK
jgi:uncharacterized protein YodC (DUF2158 family)